MRTAAAVTPAKGLWLSLLVYSSLYLFLGLVVAVLLRRQFLASPQPDELAAAATEEGPH
jgi:cytochrome d ubiquinol oxidase subunit I